MDDSNKLVAQDEPIQQFAQCHVGILKKLDMLGELPALLEPAARAREIADQAVHFFREAIFEHHLDEERELFPAVLITAKQGDERERVRSMVNRLTDEHRGLEATWKRLESGLRKVAKGQAVDIPVFELEALIAQYRSHAQYEEDEFLPMSQEILGHQSNHMAALGMSLHIRHQKKPANWYVLDALSRSRETY